ncbi:MAG: histidine kinase, partial [Bacteroidota bacterium]
MIQDEHKIMGIALTRGNFRNFTILIQVIFWCFWSVLAYSSSPAQASPIGPTLYVLQKLPLMIAGVYFNYMVLIPHLLEKKRYLAYLLAAGGLIAGLIMLRYWVDTEINGMAADQLPDWQVPIFAITIVMIGSTLFKFAEAWFSITQQKTELQNQRLQAELKFLKTQVNPHFLFNTLNNLYSLALLKDDRAPQMIAKLSEIMRYLLSDTRVVHTKLSREMELFQSYVDLHQLQDDEAKNVDIYTEGIRNKHQIASLLLI